jgi:hypothetical protein
MGQEPGRPRPHKYCHEDHERGRRRVLLPEAAHAMLAFNWPAPASASGSPPGVALWLSCWPQLVLTAALCPPQLRRTLSTETLLCFEVERRRSMICTVTVSQSSRHPFSMRRRRQVLKMTHPLERAGLARAGAVDLGRCVAQVAAAWP